MDSDLFTGRLVRLAMADPEILAENFTRWGRNSEYTRLLGSEPARLYPTKSAKEWIEKNLAVEKPDMYYFVIRTLAGDQLIGDIALDGIQWPHREAWVGIGIGEQDFWGKGYGTDAMRVILRYGFQELNLHRITLNVFEYNPRAVRSYEKAGFTIEGRIRQYLNRAGRRWDIIHMGILREEWEARNAG